MTKKKLLVKIFGILVIGLPTETLARELIINERFGNVRFEAYKNEFDQLQLQGYGDREDIVKNGVAYCKRFFPYYSKVTVGSEPLGQFQLFISRPFRVTCGFKSDSDSITPLEVRALQNRKFSKSAQEVKDAITSWAELKGYKNRFPRSSVQRLYTPSGTGKRISDRVYYPSLTPQPYEGLVFISPNFFEFGQLTFKFSLSTPLPKPEEDGFYLYDPAATWQSNKSTHIRLSIFADRGKKLENVYDPLLYQDIFKAIANALFIEAIELDPAELN
jgi:hypothetical protein